MDRCEEIALVVLLGVGGFLTGRYIYKKLGDHPAPPPPDGAPDRTFAKTAADAAKPLVSRTATTKGLHPEEAGDPGTIDRHRYFFLYRRALSKGLDDPTLQTGAGLQTLQQRIVKEYEQVFSFLKPLVGDSSARGPYYGGNELSDADKTRHGGEARHLDLGRYVKSRVFDPDATTEADSVTNAANPTSAQARTLRELDLRRVRVSCIVWRAAALDNDLWDGFGDLTLRPDDLARLLDRRLRTVERLRYEVSAGATDSGIGSSFVDRIWSPASINQRSTRNGPWQDDALVRAFELPSLPRSAKSDDGSWVVDDFFLNTRLVKFRLGISSGLARGTFTLELDGDPATIDFDATALDVQDALKALPDVGSLVITCSGGNLPFAQVLISIAGYMPAIPDLKVTANNLSGGATAAIEFVSNATDVEMDGAARFSLGGGVCEWYRNDMTSEFDYNLAPGTRVASDRWALPTFAVTQPPGYGWFMLPPHDRLTLTTTAAVTGGSFTLEFDGQPTTDLSFNASAGEVERALAAVIPTQTATVLCTGGPLRDASIAIILKNGVGAGALLKVGTSALTGASGVKPIVTPKTGSTDLPARIIADLFATIAQPTGSNLIARADWWNRSWLHSDGMLAALHLEGLRLALMRQPAAGARPDDEFNDLATRYSVALDDYFEVRKVSRLSNGVMARGRTDYFENASAGLDDLQVGDQVLFATNPALTALGRDAWDPLTVLVTDVDTSPDDPRSNLNKLRVQGFGTADVTLASLQLLLVKQADQALKGVQAFIPAEIDRLRTLATALGQSFTPPQKLSWDIGVISTAQDAANDLEVLCLWNPYGDTWDSPGPWWIRFDLNAQVWDGGFGSDAAKILSQFPGAILWPKAGKIQFANTKNPWRKATAPNIVDTANGFREPPWQDARHTSEPDTAIFIPLFQPFGGWESYFEVKAKSSAESWPSKLDPVVADARWIAGLATDTVMTTQVRVIRPRAKTHP